MHLIMEEKILEILESKHLILDSKLPKISDRIISLYYSFSSPIEQTEFKNTVLQLLHSFSNVNNFSKFGHLLFAALEIKPPNLDFILYKNIINNVHGNKTFGESTSRQICLKVLSQIPVNPVYAEDIGKFFRKELDENIELLLLHFYAKNNLNKAFFWVLDNICENKSFENEQPLLSFQFITSFKFIDPKVFEAWLQAKLQDKKIPSYILHILSKTFELAKKNYPENWQKYPG